MVSAISAAVTLFDNGRFFLEIGWPQSAHSMAVPGVQTSRLGCVIASEPAVAQLANLATLTRVRRTRQRSERAGGELLWQERRERGGARLRRIVGVDEDHLHRGAELAENLPACAAGGVAAAGGDGDGDDFLVPRGDGAADGDALGANRQAVGGVLDIAAGEDFAAGGKDGGADLEFGVRGMGVGHCSYRNLSDFQYVGRIHIECMVRWWSGLLNARQS